MGDVVLDVGSGSGTDTLIASRLVGPAGRVIGLDMTDAMRRKLEVSAARAGAANVRVIEGNADAIPLPDASVGVVTTNGVINLVPDKAAAIREIYRVLAPGGRVQLADIVVDALPSDASRAQPRLWAECIVGATSEADYLGQFMLAASATWRSWRVRTTSRGARARKRGRWRAPSVPTRSCSEQRNRPPSGQWRFAV